MKIKNGSERRIGMNVGTGGPQVWLEVGVNEVSDADWKAGKADVASYLEAGDLVEVTAKAAPAVETKTEPKKDDSKK